MSARLAVLLVIAVSGCTFANDKSQKREEGSRWEISTTCDGGATTKSAVYELSKGSTRSVSDYRCMEATTVGSCNFCDPAIDGPCGATTSGSIATLTKISGTLDARQAIYTTLHGSMGGHPTVYLEGLDGTYRCDTGMLESTHPLRPCVKVGTWKGSWWELPGPGGCQLALTNTQHPPAP